MDFLRKPFGKEERQQLGNSESSTNSPLRRPQSHYLGPQIKISRAQMLASGRSSPSMVGMSSETVG